MGFEAVTMKNRRETVSPNKPSGAAPGAGESEQSKPAKEVGGRDGPDPTRYGDWEKNGICVDF
jgi:hypothetical protein